MKMGEFLVATRWNQREDLAPSRGTFFLGIFIGHLSHRGLNFRRNSRKNPFPRKRGGREKPEKMWGGEFWKFLVTTRWNQREDLAPSSLTLFLQKSGPGLSRVSIVAGISLRKSSGFLESREK